VVLIVAVGQNLAQFIGTIVNDPLAIFTVFASSMPDATHYYLNYLVMQVFSQSMILTRYIPLSKFKVWSQIFEEEEEAKKRAEPEDQDYYGMGARTARFVTFALIGLVYGTMSPFMIFFCGILFIYMRKTYSYLLVFAETKKADLGGFFWADMMRHMYVGLFIYTILMTGIYYERARRASWRRS